ncbi:hypothetical protein AB1K32_06065 [Metabacillus dongyingensis]|uniref:hypothetical protein n=1 Tax=Metabacillus dongyingensis TaxID=2874282 RepID=UPI003B8BC19F
MYGQFEFLVLRVIDSAGSDSIFAENVLIRHNPLKSCTFASAANISARMQGVRTAG